MISRICESDRQYADPGRYLGYGTAGYRAKSSLLNRCFFRVGLVVAMRARSVGNRCGVMITASHNHHADNGIKIVEPDGSMLNIEWEPFSELIVNAVDLAAILREVQNSSAHGMLQDNDQLFGVKPMPEDVASAVQVFMAMDTRASSPELIAAVKHGLDALGVSYRDLGLLTTPQLHYQVAASADSATDFTNAFRDFVDLCKSNQAAPLQNYEPSLVLDCANGVGALPMHGIVKALRGYLEIELVNTNTNEPELLNEGCGAEFVHKDAKLPTGVDANSPKKAACFDGDADRLMYFKNLGEKPVIIDGDKQFCLLMLYITCLLKELGIEDRVSNVLVNTAYANS